MEINEYLKNNEKFFSLIDKDYIEELDLTTNNLDLKIDFKIAYLILFFQLSDDKEFEKNILLGDLFISVLTKRLAKRNPSLLIQIMEVISSYHCDFILHERRCYKRGLLKALGEVASGSKII